MRSLAFWAIFRFFVWKAVGQFCVHGFGQQHYFVQRANRKEEQCSEQEAHWTRGKQICLSWARHISNRSEQMLCSYTIFVLSQHPLALAISFSKVWSSCMQSCRSSAWTLFADDVYMLHPIWIMHMIYVYIVYIYACVFCICVLMFRLLSNCFSDSFRLLSSALASLFRISCQKHQKPKAIHAKQNNIYNTSKSFAVRWFWCVFMLSVFCSLDFSPRYWLGRWPGFWYCFWPHSGQNNRKYTVQMYSTRPWKTWHNTH